MLKLPETPEIPKDVIQSTRTNHELDKALRAKGWTDKLSQKVIDDPVLAEFLVEIAEEFEKTVIEELKAQMERLKAIKI
ncbi:MAG: hypothetical protein A2469_02850 [Candidatus Magasanikbacteria bacterium RIFOXYC2_FULL_40_16]|uniref:Uncharacterized protein n=3 Tax=Candidatus Magasanikiibacteriota TaxID=1752731 RepID=A0A1F6NFS7_9BACT|nr:MAG: hypothetical protein A2224_00810 [Candidatus Magasanikbacteria bacterium RIFOXYA2_FULL_40_20]OGH82593.1 MAG: hypothetical protein A2373_03805 [Candidatus Magasanikbacteria bacterium RIFOXYB1_FULL_40_15]OGH86407.1 MAG: hypothetical protein A2301_03290 [Candidatus Magasanikbacteria bacterium RIFOXYB2_FULL_40_13]OGH87282.1 MAG: hypothetical protein A2206_02500 [Candidatus Magasanikbacteria bacterium RIFOXYA1_FULL_40_8]OGH89717.1 MAG: hypothetical protein A2469_02850 [Candidatus Magasanikba